ncbi:MAG: glycine zipper 2TM domain-containing protein [Alteraurantiacibacter sp.]
MRKTILSLVAAAVAVTAVPAAADPPRWAPAHGHRDRHDDRNDRRVYDDRGRYTEPRRVSRGDSVWRGNDGRYYCRRDNGTTGLIIGAAGGALIGREVDSQGSRTVGTVLGAAIGGLLGREIDRGGARCR